MKLIAAFFVVLIGFVAQSQNETVIGYFNAELYNGSVYLTWRINQGYSCNGVKIERSTDSLNFTEIGSIEGVCGSVTQHSDYDFTDLNPVINATNYYRLNLQGIGYSWVVSEVVLNLEESYLIYPHPIEASSKIYFNNNDGSKHVLKLFNSNGDISFETSTYDTYFIVNQELKPGTYLFTIEGGSSTPIRGKVVF